MKKLLKALFVIGSVHAIGICASGPLTVINNPGLSYSTAVPVNLQSYGNGQTAAKNMAAQVTWSTFTLPSQSFTDGQQSTGSIAVLSNSILSSPATDQITVPSTALILGSAATGQFTVTSTATLAGTPSSFTIVLQNYSGIASSSPTLILNGQYYLTYGSNWASTDTIQHAVTTLVTAINTAPVTSLYSASVVSSTGILIVLDSSGTFGNTYTITSTSATDISTGTMSGGKNPAVLTLNGYPFTANKDWTVSATTNATALNIATAFNAALGNLITSTNTANVIYSTANVNGTVANSYTMGTSLATSISTSGVTMSGGLNRALTTASIVFNGVPYLNGYQWTDASNTSTGTTLSIVSLFQSLGVVTASTGTSGTIVYASATVNGTAANSYTLTATPASLAVSSSVFLGGINTGSVSINGKTFTVGVNFSTGAATTNTATSLATAITASSTTIGVVAAASGTVVMATSTLNGVNAYAITSNSPGLTASGATMTGGVASSYTINTQTIAIPSHGFPTGLAVYLSTTNAVGLYYSSGTVGATKTLLAGGATIYIIAVDANDIAIATTSALSQSGFAVTIISSQTSTTKDTFTLTPQTFTQGNASGQWNVSNDGINYLPFTTTLYNVAVSSDVFTAVNPSSTTLRDLGQVDYGYIEYKVVAPNAGAVNLKVILNAKD